METMARIAFGRMKKIAHIAVIRKVSSSSVWPIITQRSLVFTVIMATDGMKEHKMVTIELQLRSSGRILHGPFNRNLVISTATDASEVAKSGRNQDPKRFSRPVFSLFLLRCP